MATIDLANLLKDWRELFSLAPLIPAVGLSLLVSCGSYWYRKDRWKSSTYNFMPSVRLHVILALGLTAAIYFAAAILYRITKT